MDTIFAAAEQLFDESNYEAAFAAFQTIAHNSNCAKALRAEAYNMMGVLIAGPAPYLSKNEDESGLEYFKKAIELDDCNLGAALNIIGGYQTSPTGHSDRESVEVACNLLENQYWHELSKNDRELVLKNKNEFAKR